MALSTNTYTYTGGPQDFVVNFASGFIERDDVSVRVNGEVDGGGDPVYRNFIWIDDANITVTDPLIIGDQVTVARTVSKLELQVDFAAGADITPFNLNLIALQGLMVYQELVDGRVDGVESPIDAANRAELAASIALAAQAAAELSEDNAYISELAALASEQAAHASELAAASSASDSATSAAEAAASAAAALASEVAAAASELAASNSEGAAAASAAAALVSEGNAATSEANAAASEASAAADAAFVVRASIRYAIALG